MTLDELLAFDDVELATMRYEKMAPALADEVRIVAGMANPAILEATTAEMMEEFPEMVTTVSINLQLDVLSMTVAKLITALDGGAVPGLAVEMAKKRAETVREVLRGWRRRLREPQA